MLFLVVMSVTKVFADDGVSLQTAPLTNPTDSLKSKELSKIRETIRGFDRTQDDYIEPQHYEFTVMMQSPRTFENFVLSSNGQNIRLAPDGLTNRPVLRLAVVLLRMDLRHQEHRVQERRITTGVQLSIYSSQVGVDLYYRRTGNDYKIRVNLVAGSAAIFSGMPFGGVNVGITGVSAYYIFNHEHFSYPAAFSQSTCQKISCGSWMAGAGYTNNTLELDHLALDDALESRMPAGQEVKLDSGMMFNGIKI